MIKNTDDCGRKETMQIQFFRKMKLFRLDTENTSYLFRIGPAGELRHIWFGGEVDDDAVMEEFSERRGTSSFSPYPEGLVPAASLDILPQEYSAYGSGDFRLTAAALRKKNGSITTSTVYRSHKIFKGKKTLPGLPASFAAQKESMTLEITLTDGFSGAEIILSYSVFADSDVIARSVRVSNTTRSVIAIEKLLSAQLDFHHNDFDVIYLKGMWAKERQAVRHHLEPGIQGFSSSRGATGHQYNPGIVFAEPSATENTGDVYGMLLLYSGNYTVEAECDQYGTMRAIIGINPENFEWKLSPGETFHAPEALLGFSSEGLGGFSRMSHKFLMDHVIRSPWVHRKRPVLINNWEATYFNFDREKIYAIAKEAAKLGVEMLVLDDGWFGERNDDLSSLGDWFVNKKKLGDLGGLVRKINRLGMKFGLWFEPEMISEKSELYRRHPDWVLCIPGGRKSIARTQMVLDMSRTDVRDYLFGIISGVLHSANIEYVKWDMNRNLTEIHSLLLPPERQKETAHRYVLGVYELHERLLKEFPNLLIEDCSGGGGRFDAGMLYYAPQIWCSDDTDALERITIQMGTSLFYPASTMGAHVSVCPNHGTLRTVSFLMRGHVALGGTFGYELDITKLSADEKALVREQIRNYHEWNEIIREGNYYRLTEGFGRSNLAAWSWVSSDRCDVLVTVICKRSEPCGINPPVHLRLRGLDPETVYQLNDGRRAHGRTLMNAGIRIPNARTDCFSIIYHLKAVKSH